MITVAAVALASAIVCPSDWASFPEGEAAVGQWLRPHGSLPAVCGDHPCYMAGWTGREQSR